jgi:hypothetical protein
VVLSVAGAELLTGAAAAPASPDEVEEVVAAALAAPASLATAAAPPSADLVALVLPAPGAALAARVEKVTRAVGTEHATSSTPQRARGHLSLLEACLDMIFPGVTSGVTCPIVLVRRRRP